MSLVDELAQLGDLHQRGVLSAAEFAQAKERMLGAAASRRTPGAMGAINALQRSRRNRWFGGVCGGLAEVSGLAPWAWRIFFILAVLCAGTGVFAYVLLWIFVPEESLETAGAPTWQRAG